MVAHPLPPLPPRSRDDIENREGEQLAESGVDRRGRILEQTFAGEELEHVDSYSHQNGNPDKFLSQGGLAPRSDVDGTSKHIRPGPLAVDNLLLPLSDSSYTTSDVLYDSRADLPRKSRFPVASRAIHKNDGREAEAEHTHRTYGELSQHCESPLPPPSPHVRFTLPIPHHPLPLLPSSSPSHQPPPSPFYEQISRPTLRGARTPPWDSSTDLALDRRYRTGRRTHGDSLTERFERESRRLVEERRVADEEMRAGKRWTEVDELRKLVWGVYPEMEFQVGGRGSRCCCGVM